MKTFFVINLGCKVNLYETNAVCSQLRQAGFKQVAHINKANIVLINTCSVTNKADAKSRNMINRAKAAKLKPIVIVMGCFSQLNKSSGDIVVGTSNRSKIVEYLNLYLKNKKQIVKTNQDHTFEEFPCFKYFDNTRAFLKIQDGCDFFCNYCLIPYCRGRQRAMNHKRVLESIKWYVKQGYKEIVLTGVNTAGYQDEQYSFYDLLCDINKLDGNFRIRISSLEPFQISKKIIDLLASNPNRWANQIHLCLQSANDKVLNDMNRKYKINDFSNLVKYIKNKMPNVSITTDYIVAFPTESEILFKNSLINLEKIKFSNMNIFIYSRRNGTVADKKYPIDISSTVARNRFNVINKLRLKYQKLYLQSLVGKTLNVLVEKSNAPLMQGYSSEFVKVLFNSKVNLRNKLVKIKITKLIKDQSCYCLFGKK